MPFGCLLVPIVLRWGGSSWSTALAVAGLLLLLTVVCLVVLTFTDAGRR